MDNFYDFKAVGLSGDIIDFSNYQGKAVLVVNTASKCGFTPQYKGLEELYKSYKDNGLEILGFPCNQFGRQEPGEKQDIESTCYINYGVSFQMFEKVNVNGPDAHPLFKYLCDSLPGIFGTKRVKWNFTKFLINPTGEPFKRFAPVTNPKYIDRYIADLL